MIQSKKFVKQSVKWAIQQQHQIQSSEDSRADDDAAAAVDWNS